MDWRSWLSRSSLPPPLADEYGLLFSLNDLQEEDIEHLDHELLLSMGVSVAKRRLEILKLARKEKRKKKMGAAAAATKKLREFVAAHIGMMTRWSSSVMAATSGGWRENAVRRRRRRRTTVAAEQGRLMITDGGPAVHDSVGVRWDTMFKNLKPT
ncbi:hypothetical protein AXF42_Ash009333 [Apostasia shenzhenica]|uniref:SAM domain-containing protein n=1 Tax=Apostasia shenzhenica TaxID=1088818 RepID=A0A2I0B3S6_9ASPA|nr:hypothetical protein AXF42_Ash009333 [Apostasia shenzhenica]